jgi:hypothetical protein
VRPESRPELVPGGTEGQPGKIMSAICNISRDGKNLGLELETSSWAPKNFIIYEANTRPTVSVTAWKTQMQPLVPGVMAYQRNPWELSADTHVCPRTSGPSTIERTKS